jgi:hypothetical protein
LLFAAGDAGHILSRIPAFKFQGSPESGLRSADPGRDIENLTALFIYPI